MELPLSDAAKNIGIRKISEVEVKAGPADTKKIQYITADPTDCNREMIETGAKENGCWTVYKSYKNATHTDAGAGVSTGAEETPTA